MMLSFGKLIMIGKYSEVYPYEVKSKLLTGCSSACIVAVVFCGEEEVFSNTDRVGLLC